MKLKERITPMDEFEQIFSEDEDEFCHLKWENGKYVCGLGEGNAHGIAWDGSLGGFCPSCGKSICPDCTLAVKDLLGFSS